MRFSLSRDHQLSPSPPRGAEVALQQAAVRPQGEDCESKPPGQSGNSELLPRPLQGQNCPAHSRPSSAWALGPGLQGLLLSQLALLHAYIAPRLCPLLVRDTPLGLPSAAPTPSRAPAEPLTSRGWHGHTVRHILYPGAPTPHQPTYSPPGRCSCHACFQEMGAQEPKGWPAWAGSQSWAVRPQLEGEKTTSDNLCLWAPLGTIYAKMAIIPRRAARPPCKCVKHFMFLTVTPIKKMNTNK